MIFKRTGALLAAAVVAAGCAIPAAAQAHKEEQSMLREELEGPILLKGSR